MYKQLDVALTLFDVQLVVMIGVRKSLDFIFTQYELKVLDDLMPESHKKHKEDDDEEVSALVHKSASSNKHVSFFFTCSSCVRVSDSSRRYHRQPTHERLQHQQKPQRANPATERQHSRRRLCFVFRCRKWWQHCHQHLRGGEPERRLEERQYWQHPAE